MKRKTNKNYKFGDALKEASPLFHAKYGKKGKYEKKGGGNDGPNDDGKNADVTVTVTGETGLTETENKPENKPDPAVTDPTREADTSAPAVTTETNPIETNQTEADAPVADALGGKKAKKSAKKGKKSAKKGGKKAKKSAKKGKR